MSDDTYFEREFEKAKKKWEQIQVAEQQKKKGKTWSVKEKKR
jgi:hypothetical protein